MTDSSRSLTLSSIPPTLTVPEPPSSGGGPAHRRGAALPQQSYTAALSLVAAPLLAGAASARCRQREADAWHHIGILLGAGRADRRRAGARCGKLVERQRHRHHRGDHELRRQLPALRTLGSATLSVVVVGMGASLGREGAPEAGGSRRSPMRCADRGALSDEQRRLLVACGAGAGMAAAYGVPLGGACSPSKCCAACWRCGSSCRRCSPRRAPPASPGARDAERAHLRDSLVLLVGIRDLLVDGRRARSSGVFSVGFVRVIAWADRNKPNGRRPAARTGRGARTRSARSPSCSRNCSATARISRSSPSPIKSRPPLLLALSCSGPGDGAVPGERRAGRLVHAVPRDRRAARRRARCRLVLDLAGHASRALRHHRRRRRARRHHSWTHLVDRAGDGAHGSRPLVHFADAASRSSRRRWSRAPSMRVRSTMPASATGR